jgi:8-oxo-dGTP diphosphatase
MSANRQLVVGGLLIRGETLMLGLRSAHRRYFPSVWDAIGGHVERGETADDALRRELFEEIGVTPTVFSTLGVFSQPGVNDCRMYRVDAWDGDEPRIRDDEHDALAWFTVEEACALPNLSSGYYRDIFRALKVSRR